MYEYLLFFFAIKRIKCNFADMISRYAINIIKDYFSTQPIDKAWIFGSYSRGEEKENSDIDILVKYDEDGVSLLTHARILNQLEKLLGKSVDLVEDGYLLPFAEKTANKDKQLIYERADKR